MFFTEHHICRFRGMKIIRKHPLNRCYFQNEGLLKNCRTSRRWSSSLFLISPFFPINEPLLVEDKRLSTVSYISTLTVSFHWFWVPDYCACVCVAVCMCVWFTGGWSSVGHTYISIITYLICQKVSLKTCFWNLLHFVFPHKPGLAGWRDGLVWTEANKHVFTLCLTPPSVI